MSSSVDYAEVRRDLLQRRRARIASHQGALREITALEQQEHDPEAEESAQSSYAHTTLLELSEAQRRELEEIDRALARLDMGIYGECMDCSSLISSARMRVLPFSVFCADCAAAREVGREGQRPSL